MPSSTIDSNTRLPNQQSYISGCYQQNTSGQTFDTIHPGNNTVICSVEKAGHTEVNTAVASARKAFTNWSKTPAVERASVLNRAASILRARNEDLAQLETLDTGKPITETRTADILPGVDVMEYYAGIVQSIQGDYIDLPPNACATIKREPLGVCAGIAAWNFPIQIAMWKSSPALACGNTMVIKPSELTPLSTLKLAEIYTEAGLPDGAFNVIQGDGETGQMLVSHPDVAKVSITGSVATGHRVMHSAASGLKKISLELGGKSPVIVFDDANLEDATNAIIVNNFSAAGQVCSHATRVFIHRKIYPQLIEMLIAGTESIKVGNPFDESTDMGPLISRRQFEKALDYLQRAETSSARIVTGGQAMNRHDLAQGFYISPTIVTDCTDDMPWVQEEVFGPLMSVLVFDSEDEVISRANATSYGLASGVFTNDFSRAHRVANALQTGTVWINDYGPLPASVPFGGYKHSGIGKENGLAAIEQYTQQKLIYANLGTVANV